MAVWEKIIKEYYEKKSRLEADSIFEMIDAEIENIFGPDVLNEASEQELIANAAKPEVLTAVMDLLRKNGYPNASVLSVFKKDTKNHSKGTARIQNLGDKQQRQAIHNLLMSTLEDSEKNQFSDVSYKHVIYKGQEMLFIKGEKRASADGVPVAQNPNRGDVSEAFIGLAVMLRLLHLPEVATKGPDGVEIKPRGLVNPQQIKDFLINGYKGVKPTVDESGNLVANAKITSPSGKVDTLKMEIGLRHYSLEGLMKIGDPNAFVNRDQQTKAYLNAAAEYANREVIKWALGVVQDATGESDPDKALGWFINDFNNDIMIRGVGTDNQKDTKVDMAMTCSKPNECPLTKVSIDGMGDLEGDRQLARLSLKAGSVPHFGGGAATSVENAISVMESVFTGGREHPKAKQWADYHLQNGTFDGKDQAARREALNQLVMVYAEYAEQKLGAGGEASDRDFLESMVEGILQHSVRGKNDFKNETGLLLVQSTDAGDFYKLDFDKLPEILGDGANYSAKATLTSGGSPYLGVYQSVGEGPDGSKVNLPEPSSHLDKNVLFWIRTLARTGAEILRLEKGALAKKVLAVPSGQKLVYRDGKVVAIPDDQE